jgi:hypothetical protein
MTFSVKKDNYVDEDSIPDKTCQFKSRLKSKVVIMISGSWLSIFRYIRHYKTALQELTYKAVVMGQKIIGDLMEGEFPD